MNKQTDEDNLAIILLSEVTTIYFFIVVILIATTFNTASSGQLNTHSDSKVNESVDEEYSSGREFGEVYVSPYGNVGISSGNELLDLATDLMNF